MVADAGVPHLRLAQEVAQLTLLLARLPRDILCNVETGAAEETGGRVHLLPVTELSSHAATSMTGLGTGLPLPLDVGGCHLGEGDEDGSAAAHLGPGQHPAHLHTACTGPPINLYSIHTPCPK